MYTVQLVPFLYISPQNELLPASERVPAQTTKKSTGPIDRKKLLNHIKTQAENSTVVDDYVPFVKKQPKETQQAAKPEPTKKKVATEFDDMLDMLDEEDLTELAGGWSL